MLDSVGEFLHMGGYAFYVWSSYALTLVVLLANVWWSARILNRHRRRVREHAQRSSGSQRRQRTHDA